MPLLLGRGDEAGSEMLTPLAPPLPPPKVTSPKRGKASSWSITNHTARLITLTKHIKKKSTIRKCYTQVNQRHGPHKILRLSLLFSLAQWTDWTKGIHPISGCFDKRVTNRNSSSSSSCCSCSCSCSCSSSSSSSSKRVHAFRSHSWKYEVILSTQP